MTQHGSGAQAGERSIAGKQLIATIAGQRDDHMFVGVLRQEVRVHKSRIGMRLID
jgi:hypothetical protein